MTLINSDDRCRPAVERAMKIWARRPSALISATYEQNEKSNAVDIFGHLDELSPLVLLDIQIKPLRLNLEHLRRKLLNFDR